MSSTLAVAPSPKVSPAVTTVAAVPERSRTSQLSFFLFLLLTGTVFLRPAEIIPSIEGLPIYEALIVSCLFLSINFVRDRVRRDALVAQPLTVCVLGITVAVILSQVTHAYLSGAVESGTLFVKTLLYYLLLVALVDTPARLRKFVLTTALCAVGMVGLCVLDYVGWVDFQFITHIEDRDDEEDETGATKMVLRMRGTGIFEDPNDLGLLIIGAVVMCSYFLMDRRHDWARLLWMLPISLLMLGLVYTRSRGCILAGGAAFMTMLLLWYGQSWAILVGALGMAALPLVAGRQGNISIGSGTGQDRIQLWAEGLAEIKSFQVLFGIGQGMYADAVGLVAHNSFVHAYVELGYFGGTFFFGAFFFAAWGLIRMTTQQVWLRDAELQRFGPYLASILAGWCMGMMSLSRCYVVPTYLIVGLNAAYLTLAGRYSIPPRWLVIWDWRHCRGLLACSAVFLVGLELFVRVFADFG